MLSQKSWLGSTDNFPCVRVRSRPAQIIRSNLSIIQILYSHFSSLLFRWAYPIIQMIMTRYSTRRKFLLVLFDAKPHSLFSRAFSASSYLSFGWWISLAPRPKTNPSPDRFQYRARGRKGLVDIVHISKDSLPLIQTCWNYQNFTRGQEVVGDKCHGRLACLLAVLWAICAIVGVWILHRRWTLESASFSKCYMQHSSREECLPSNSVWKAYSQKVKKLLNFESSVSSILSTLKAGVRRLSERREQTSVHILIYLQSVQRWKITVWRLPLCQPRRHRAMKHFFRIANSTSLLVVFTTLQNYHAFANLHFCIHSANLVYVIEITCWTIWLDPPNAWRSLRYAGYIYQTVFPFVILEAIYAPDEVWGRD